MTEESRWECRAFGSSCLLGASEKCNEKHCFFIKSLDFFQIGIALYRKNPYEPLYVNDAGKETADRWIQDMLHEISKELEVRFRNRPQLPLTTSVKIKERIFGFTVYPVVENLLMVIFRDVTQIEKARTIEQYRNVYERYNQIISEIIHEIGNPLAGIMGILQVTLLNLDSYDREDIIKKMDSALLEVKRLSKILKLLRPLGADSQAPWERINVKESLRFVLEEKLAGHMSISCRFEKMPDNWHATVRKVDFIKVVGEIIDNAISAMQDGGEIVIRHGQETMRHREILIQNTGPLIAEDMLERVFYPFFSNYDGRKGTGLTIARKRMLNMGGMLFAKPCSSGACFVILIPSEGPAYELLSPIS